MCQRGRGERLPEPSKGCLPVEGGHAAAQHLNTLGTRDGCNRHLVSSRSTGSDQPSRQTAEQRVSRSDRTLNGAEAGSDAFDLVPAT